MLGNRSARGLLSTMAAGLAVMAIGYAPEPAGGAGPGSGGTGGSGGSGGTPDVGDVYADLVVLWRDVDGVPLLAEFSVEGEDGTTTEYCVQPVSYEPLPGLGDEYRVVNGADGREVWRIPLLGQTGIPPGSLDEEVEVCDPDPAYAMYVRRPSSSA